MSLGSKIKEFILNNFSSIQSFADIVGIQSEALYRYFNDSVVPSANFLKKLQELGCDINWLLSEDDKPPPQTNILLEKRIKELEEENERLRNSIRQISILTQAIEINKNILRHKKIEGSNKDLKRRKDR